MNGSGIADRGVACLRRGCFSCVWGASRALPGASERYLLAWGSVGRRVTEFAFVAGSGSECRLIAVWGIEFAMLRCGAVDYGDSVDV